jgi:beta-lactamase regulating signal transducer with metallopeptidase domain
METVINISIATSVTALIILGIKSLLKNKISPKWQFALWIILLLRLLVPVLPESRASVLNALPQVQNIEVSERQVQSTLPEIKSYITGNVVVGESNKEVTFNKKLIDNVFGIWLAGSIIMLLYSLGIYWLYHI